LVATHSHYCWHFVVDKALIRRKIVDRFSGENQAISLSLPHKLPSCFRTNVPSHIILLSLN
jgi:hypothetical protein